MTKLIATGLVTTPVAEPQTLVPMFEAPLAEALLVAEPLVEAPPAAEPLELVLGAASATFKSPVIVTPDERKLPTT